MAIGPINAPTTTVPPRPSEATERTGAPDHDGDGDDSAVAAPKSSTATGPLEPGFSLHA